MNLNVGDIVELKKAHPCGGFKWEIIRAGADFKIKCTTCNHIAMITRKKLERRVRRVEPKK